MRKVPSAISGPTLIGSVNITYTGAAASNGEGIHVLLTGTDFVGAFNASLMSGFKLTLGIGAAHLVQGDRAEHQGPNPAQQSW